MVKKKDGCQNGFNTGEKFFWFSHFSGFRVSGFWMFTVCVNKLALASFISDTIKITAAPKTGLNQSCYFPLTLFLHFSGTGLVSSTI
jgi:hypothetical protein